MNGSTGTGGLSVRRFQASDEPAVLDLLGTSLGWEPTTPYAELFAYKHLRNVFGPSPAWVAVDQGRVVGFRAFLRWEFLNGRRPVRALRAVDTATHPDYRGRGVFSRLTRHGITAACAEGAGFVFNTPNAQSRPGYLKLGWQPVGRLPAVVRPASVSRAQTILRARTSAELWSRPTQVGEPVAEVLADDQATGKLLATARPSTPVTGAPGSLVTRRTPAFLRWRYGFEPLHYRAMLAGDSPTNGLLIFRLRRRGPALEAVIAERLLPTSTRPGPLVRRVLHATGADYAIALRAPGERATGLLPAPRQGPLLVWRSLTEARRPSRRAWALSLGDVELF
jgi:GNAT superfamily N-acetyltransferase